MHLEEMYQKKKESEIVPLTMGISAVGTVIPVADVNALSDPPNIAILFDRIGNNVETFKYEGKSANALTNVTRGLNTVPRAWTPWSDSDGRPMINVTNGLTSHEHDIFVRNILKLKTEIENIDVSGLPSDLQDTLNALKARLDDVESDIADLATQTSVNALTGRVDALEAALNALDIDALQDAIDQIKDLLDDLPPDWNFLRAADLIPITDRLDDIEKQLEWEVWD